MPEDPLKRVLAEALRDYHDMRRGMTSISGDAAHLAAALRRYYASEGVRLYARDDQGRMVPLWMIERVLSALHLSDRVGRSHPADAHCQGSERDPASPAAVREALYRHGDPHDELDASYAEGWNAAVDTVLGYLEQVGWQTPGGSLHLGVAFLAGERPVFRWDTEALFAGEDSR